MANTILIIIVSITILEYLVSLILSYLNSSWRTKKLPPELNDIYKEDEYKKSQNYGKINSRFAILTDSFSLIILLLVFFYGIFAWVDNYAHEIADNQVVAALLFFGIIFFASDIINTPFDIYAVFKIEEKFGFNKTTAKTFILDKLKSWLISAIFGGIILSLIIWFYMQTTDLFWLYAWAALSMFSIFMAMFYSNIIVPLFNKQTPLEEGELRDAISKFSEKAGFSLVNIFVIDGSKRSSKANAYFTGLGHKKRIVLYDTLIKDLSVNEIVAVLAHEVGHYKLKHTLSSIILSIIQTGIIFYILSLFIANPNLSKALGGTQTTFELNVIAFFILFSPISTVVGLFMNIFSRKNEYQADSFAAQYGYTDELISALKKLSVNSLSNLTPHPAFVFVNYLHPTLYQRIISLRKKPADLSAI